MALMHTVFLTASLICVVLSWVFRAMENEAMVTRFLAHAAFFLAAGAYVRDA